MVGHKFLCSFSDICWIECLRLLIINQNLEIIAKMVLLFSFFNGIVLPGFFCSIYLSVLYINEWDLAFIPELIAEYDLLKFSWGFLGDWTLETNVATRL